MPEHFFHVLEKPIKQLSNIQNPHAYNSIKINQRKNSVNSDRAPIPYSQF